MEFRLPIHWICSDALGVIFHMLKHSNLLGLSGLIVLGLTGSAIAAPKDFIGTWINKDSNSPGVSRFIVKEKSPGKLTVQGFTACKQKDCDMGSGKLVTYGTSIEDKDHKFATVSGPAPGNVATYIFTLELTAPDEISGQGFTQLINGGDHQNYAGKDTFRRAP
jgi:hypothetical protein